MGDEVLLHYLARRPVLLGFSLLNVYTTLHNLGLVRSKREYARRWLGRGETYLRDYEHRAERQHARVSPTTVATLRSRLCAVSAVLAPRLARDLNEVVRAIDRDCRVADLLRR